MTVLKHLSSGVDGPRCHHPSTTTHIRFGGRTPLALCKLWGLDRRQKRAPAPDLTAEFNHRWIEPLHTPYASSEEKSSVAETMHISIVHVADFAINFRTRHTTALSKTQERIHHAVLSQRA